MDTNEHKAEVVSSRPPCFFPGFLEHWLAQAIMSRRDFIIQWSNMSVKKTGEDEYLLYTKNYRYGFQFDHLMPR
jgi:hypothetical protein